jgi:hypothetical protein
VLTSSRIFALNIGELVEYDLNLQHKINLNVQHVHKEQNFNAKRREVCVSRISWTKTLSTLGFTEICNKPHNTHKIMTNV